MNTKRLLVILLFIAAILLIPLVAMQFSTEVSWQPFDFMIAGLILVGASLGIQFVLRRFAAKKYRVLLLIAILVMLVLVWAELGVGLFGSPVAGS